MNRDCALCISWWPSQTMYINIRASTEVTLLSSFKKARWMEKNPPLCHVCSLNNSYSHWRSVRTLCFNLLLSPSLSIFSLSLSPFLCFDGHERACLECFLSKVACLCMFFVFIQRKSVSEKSVLEKKQIALECKNSLVWFHMNLTLHANTFSNTWMIHMNKKI